MKPQRVFADQTTQCNPTHCIAAGVNTGQGISLARLPFHPEASCACEGACPRCQPVQTKLKTGTPHDRFEKEADHMAEQLVTTPRDLLAANASPNQSILNRTFNQEPLNQEDKTFYGNELGQDLSNVRLTLNAESKNRASALGARAYTQGAQIYFNQGEYAPHTSDGQRTLAHELVHVKQQRRNSQAPQIQCLYFLTEMMPAGQTVRRGLIASDPDTYFYQGSAANTTNQCAMIIGGIHAGENPAGDLGLRIKQELDSGSISPFYHVLIMPDVVPGQGRSGVRSAGTGTTRVPDLNREFGTGYNSPNPWAQKITQAITEFNPGRVLSIHCIGNSGKVGIYLDPIHNRVRLNPQQSERNIDQTSYPAIGNSTQRAQAYTADTRNLAAMQLTESMVSQVTDTALVTGNLTPPTGFPDSQYPGTGAGTSQYNLLYPDQGNMTGGVSLGVWGSGHGRTIITMELPYNVGFTSYGGSRDDWSKYAGAINAFLGVQSQPASAPATAPVAPTLVP